MNKKLVMWGTFLIVFFLSIVGSYKFINRNNQDMTIELSAPTLPLITVVLEGEHYNTLRGYTGNTDVSDVAKYVCPVSEDRIFKGSVETFGTDVTGVSYEIEYYCAVLQYGGRWKIKILYGFSCESDYGRLRSIGGG